MERKPAILVLQTFGGPLMSTAVSLRLPEDLKTRLERLSRLTGRSKTFYMVEAISEKLADLEDLYLAEQRSLALRAGRSRTYTLDEVEKRLGLSDLVD
jgi:RHH-type transcriptional regulator, rel operon repressor / antitoxin RelB